MTIPKQERIRAVSWWLTHEDFRWPDRDIADKIKWKADNMAANGCNLGLIFGAHWRWDWLPVFTMVHDLIGTIAEALHERGIQLYDHHSAVLAQRYNTAAELREIRKRHPHHISPAPTFEAGASWEFDGKRLDDWRMIDIHTGRPAYAEAYATNIFCINNPDFVAAYIKYVKQLIATTNVDGLHCDDGMYYGHFSSCGCRHCRAHFRERYGRELPPDTEAGFWGNWDNPAWRRWVDMRHETTGAFLRQVAATLPPGFPLSTCLSGSIHSSGNSTGQGTAMLGACNVLMLEMCKNMPDLDGDPTRPMPTQLFQLAHAEKRRIPVMSCGYGYSAATANVVWAFSKFLGADCWFSTNKGRLSLPFSCWARLPDDSELPGRGYNFEKTHPELFVTASEPELLVYYSDASRRYYGGGVNDYVRDYQEAVWKSLRANYSVGTAIEIPQTPGTGLLLCSVAALSDAERAALQALAAAGGTVAITGPCGIMDETGAPTQPQFTEKFGYRQQLGAMPHQSGFPDSWYNAEPQKLGNTPKWSALAPGIFYHPTRMQDPDSPDLAAVFGSPRFHADGWLLRTHRDAAGNTLLHGFAGNFTIGFNAAVEAMRIPDAPWGNRIIDRVAPKDAARSFTLPGIAAAELITPLDDTNGKLTIVPAGATVELPEPCFYFILKITGWKGR